MPQHHTTADQVRSQSEPFFVQFVTWKFQLVTYQFFYVWWGEIFFWICLRRWPFRPLLLSNSDQKIIFRNACTNSFSFNENKILHSQVVMVHEWFSSWSPMQRADFITPLQSVQRQQLVNGDVTALLKGLGIANKPPSIFECQVKHSDRFFFLEDKCFFLVSYIINIEDF